MGEPRVSNPLVDQFRRGGVPTELRVLAAQGALPLKPSDLVELLHFLLGDSDPAVKSAAVETLMSLPAEELLPLLRDRETAPEVLGWAVAHRPQRELREAALQNTSTSDEAIEAVASSLPENLAELVVINQTRLLRRTSLLEALETNPNLNNDQKRRLRELRETFRIGEKPAEAAPPRVAPPAAAAAPPAEQAPPAAPEPLEEGPTTEAEAIVRYLSEDERQASEKVSAVQRLYRLNTAQKVITALKGNREERAILVRDPNRLVATAVLGSPRVTDAEIESFAAMKNVSDEILRQIGRHKEWTKRYSVVLNLVKNPRTPIAISIGMVSRLNPRDLKGLAVDRNVAEVIRKHAQKFSRGPQAGAAGGAKH
jgi:hypothetical protein